MGQRKGKEMAVEGDVEHATWQSVQDQPGVSSTTNERYEDLLNRVDKWSQSDPLHFPSVTFLQALAGPRLGTELVPFISGEARAWLD
jgi:hypothetical protein